MNKPTVNDIAREAGVSLATVDRVLNGRPGVRDRTVAAVNQAVARLGYVRDIAAANLARGRSYHVVVAVPASTSQLVQTLVATLEDAASQAAAARLEMELIRFPPEDMHVLAAELGALPTGIAGVALMAPETPVVRDAVRALRARSSRRYPSVRPSERGARRDHDETTAPQSQPGFQGEGGTGGHEGREDAR